jgi:hypothetical protein
MANFMVQADEAGMQRLFLENLAHPTTQEMLAKLREAMQE